MDVFMVTFQVRVVTDLIVLAVACMAAFTEAIVTGTLL